MELEWTIGNISHWNREVHGVSIAGPHDLIQLYPRGTGNPEGYVEVRIPNEYMHSEEASMELLYPSLDGSMRSVELSKRRHRWLGPNFDAIVAAIKKKESTQPDEVVDKLTVLWRKASGPSGRFITQVPVTDTSAKLSADTFKHSAENKLIFEVVYNRGENGGREYLKILASTTKDTSGEVAVEICAKPTFREKTSLRRLVSFRQSEEGFASPCVTSDHVILGDDVLKLCQLRIHERTEGVFEFRFRVAPGWFKYDSAQVVFPDKREVGILSAAATRPGPSIPSAKSEEISNHSELEQHCAPRNKDPMAQKRHVSETTYSSCSSAEIGTNFKPPESDQKSLQSTSEREHQGWTLLKAPKHHTTPGRSTPYPRVSSTKSDQRPLHQPTFGRKLTLSGPSTDQTRPSISNQTPVFPPPTVFTKLFAPKYQISSLHQYQITSFNQGNISSVHRLIQGSVTRGSVSRTRDIGTREQGTLDPHSSALFEAFLNRGTVAEDLGEDSALRLYRAAHEHRVPALKRECADFLSDKMSISNVSRILRLANKYRDEQLKSRVQDFIVKYKTPKRYSYDDAHYRSPTPDVNSLRWII